VTVGISPVEDELYREIILDHWRTPRHHGVLDPADVRVEGNNPLCGDEVVLTARLRDGRVEQIAFDGQGCSISRASASMMCEGVCGAAVEDARELLRRFRTMMLERGSTDGVGDLEALQGVAAMPARVKCAVLAWNALAHVLAGENGTVTTENGDLQSAGASPRVEGEADGLGPAATGGAGSPVNL
jgi:nitrogen fixation NifU-like protein